MLENLSIILFGIIILILIDKFNNWWEEQWIKKEIRK